MKLPQTVSVKMTGHEAALLIGLAEQAKAEAELARRMAQTPRALTDAAKTVQRVTRVRRALEDAILYGARL